MSFQNTIAVSNGLSDFHVPIERHHRDYKYFDQSKFKNNLNEKVKVLLTMNYLKLLSLKCSKTCFIKKEITYANYALYITKALSKAIMHRFELKTKYVKTKTQTKLKLYKKHKNFYSKLYKMERRKS